MNLRGFHGQVPASTCPGCKGLATGATSADANRRAPKAGDCTVCIECGQISQFSHELELVALSDAELLKLPAAVRQQLRAMRRAVRDRVERLS